MKKILNLIKFWKLTINYLSAYSTDSQENKQLKRRVILMHSWVKLHQNQVNNANRIKNETLNELKQLEEKYKLMCKFKGE